MKNVPFYRLRNAHKIQFLENVINLGSDFDLGAINLENEFTSISAKLLAANSGFELDQASVYTEQIMTADQRRDNALKYLRGVAKCNEWHHAEEKRTAGGLLMRKIDKYGERAYALGLVEETKVLNSIVNDLAESDAVNAIALLGLADSVDELEESNTLVNTLWIDRVKERSDNEEVSATASLKEAILLYQNLQTKLEALLVISPTDMLNNLHKRLNELVDEFRSL